MSEKVWVFLTWKTLDNEVWRCLPFSLKIFLLIFVATREVDYITRSFCDISPFTGTRLSSSSWILDSCYTIFDSPPTANLSTSPLDDDNDCVYIVENCRRSSQSWIFPLDSFSFLHFGGWLHWMYSKATRLHSKQTIKRQIQCCWRGGVETWKLAKPNKFSRTTRGRICLTKIKSLVVARQKRALEWLKTREVFWWANKWKVETRKHFFA